MMMQSPFHPHHTTFKNHWGAFLGFGIILFLIGLVAIGASAQTTLITVVVLGVFLLSAGLLMMVDAFTFWWRKWQGFFLHLIMGLLYFAVGLSLITNPVLSSISITLLLGIFYLIIGLFRGIYALSIRTPRWGWNFLNGLISLLLGVLILAAWPASSLFIIGLFVGIDLIFSGLTYIMAALGARSLNL
ncbi:MAG: HdeD family acid-resistance protein [Gammaproteobacteria bacterium]|nr:HdeD family acid-resistance protein [Gammaproteobacteria bacterium]